MKGRTVILAGGSGGMGTAVAEWVLEPDNHLTGQLLTVDGGLDASEIAQ